MIPLIDGDIIVYTMAYVTERFDEAETAKRVSKYLMKILADVGSDGRYLIFLTGSKNFRYDIFPDYKKSRKHKPKPRHYRFIRDYLVEKWNAVIVNKIEADDALSITQHYFNRIVKDGDVDNTTIICSKDKDLLQIPGYHYKIPINSTIPFEIVKITEEEGWLRLMKQTLMGDKVDDIPGAKGIGDIKSSQLINSVPLFKVMYASMMKYYEINGDAGPGLFWLNFQLVKLLDKQAYGFEIPQICTVGNETITKFKDLYSDDFDERFEDLLTNNN